MDEITLFQLTQASGIEFPLTAWEQIAVVCVFALIFISIIVAMLNWFSKERKSTQVFQSEQQKQWQLAIKEMNLSWQHWLDEQSSRECASMDKVTEALDRLAAKIDDHDGKVEDRFNRAVTTITKCGGRAQ